MVLIAITIATFTAAPPAARATFAGLPTEDASTSYPQGDSSADEAGRRVMSIASNNDYVFVGGGFTEFGGSIRTHLAFINRADASLDDTSFAVNPPPQETDSKQIIRDITTDEGTDDDLWIGGDIADIDGTPVAGDMARFNYDPATDAFNLDTNFSPPSEISRVFGMDKTPVGLIVAADSGIYSLDPDSGSQNWKVSISTSAGSPPFDYARPYGLDAYGAGDFALVAGNFTSLTSPVNGQQTRYMAALIQLSDGRVMTNWNPNWTWGNCSEPCYPTSGVPASTGDPTVWAVSVAPGGDELVLGTGGSGSRGGNNVRVWSLSSQTPDDELCHATASGDPGNVQGLDTTAKYIFAGHHGNGISTTREDSKIFVSKIDDCSKVNWQPTTYLNSITGTFAVLADESNLYVGGSFTQPRVSLAVFPEA
jgi:hypothetical protein